MDIKNGRLKKPKKKRRAPTIAWRLSRGWDWCVPEDEKQKQKNCEDKPFFVSDDRMQNFLTSTGKGLTLFSFLH